MTSPIYLSFLLPIFAISIMDLLIDNEDILKYTDFEIFCSRNICFSPSSYWFLE